MDAVTEQEAQLSPPETESSLAKIASSQFRKVSARFPGFELAQAADLALAYQRSGKTHEPLDLSKALLNNPAEVEALRQMAIEIHKKHQKEEPKIPGGRLGKAISRYFRPPQGPPLDIATERMRCVIEEVFISATDLKDRDPAKLEQIIGFCPQYKDLELPHGQRLDQFNEKVKEILPQLKEK